jgi:hypothetical protein
MNPKPNGVLQVSEKAVGADDRFSGFEVIDCTELARRWKVPASWIRARSNPARTPAEARIPCVRLGRYVRYEWGSPQLEAWFAKQRTK